MRGKKRMMIPKGAVLGMAMTMLYASTASATAVVTQKLGSLNELVLGIVTAAGVIVLKKPVLISMTLQKLYWTMFQFTFAAINDCVSKNVSVRIKKHGFL